MNGPTNIDAIALPVEMVTLKKLRTKSGEPVVVKCESVSELVLAEITGGLPGARPESERDEPDELEMVRVANQYGQPIIEAGTALLDAEGNEVRPAFYFGERKHPLSIPGRLLHEEDKAAMVVAILRLGGYVGGAAESASFHAEDGTGRAGGDGTMEVLPGDGTDSSASVA